MSARDSTHRRLDSLRPGQSATIRELCVEHDPRLTARLLALGFSPDTPIRALRRAPLGDPTEYELRGTRMSLRRHEAHAILLHDATTDAE